MNPVLQLLLGTIAIGVGGFAFAVLLKDVFDTALSFLRDLFGRRGR